MLDLSTNAIFISHDVVFDEHIFPFTSSSHSASFFSYRVLPSHSLLDPYLISTPSPIQSSLSSNDAPLSTSSRSHRVTKSPSYLQDFHCYFVSHVHHSISHPLSSVLAYDKLSPTHRAFVCSISSRIEPATYSQAAISPDWQRAMQKELTALEHNGTWSIVSLPAGKQPVGCKWVYKLKFCADGTLNSIKPV